MLIIFTDLDGTLLDRESYSYDAALPALALIKDMRIPLVLVTSKTRAEVEVWRKRLENRDPFIVENGGALYLPGGYFPLTFQPSTYRHGYAVMEFGTPYEELVDALRTASLESQCRVVGFHEMNIEEVSFRCGISLEQAFLAKQREYDEPFEVLDPRVERLLDCIESRKKRWTRGGRFHHILGANDKAHCVLLLTRFFQRVYDRVTTVGLGDSFNDAGFLKVVDFPIVLKSADSARVRAEVPSAHLTDLPGPCGWNRAIMETLRGYDDRMDRPATMVSTLKTG